MRILGIVMVLLALLAAFGAWYGQGAHDFVRTGDAAGGTVAITAGTGDSPMGPEVVAVGAAQLDGGAILRGRKIEFERVVVGMAAVADRGGVGRNAGRSMEGSGLGDRCAGRVSLRIPLLI